MLQIISGDNDNVQPVLSLKVGENHCSFAITDKDSHTLKALAYYTSEKITETRLDTLMTAHPELATGGYHTVCIGYDYHHNILMPGAGIGAAKEMLEGMYGRNGSSMMLTDHMSRWNMQNAFMVPAKVHEWMKGTFRQAKFFHGYSVLSANTDKSNGNDYLFVDLQSQDFVLLAVKNNKLLLAQTYYYSTPEDVLYHLLKVCEQFAFSQQEVLLQLSGLVDKQSALYRELYQYFIHVSFREPSWKTPPHEYPAHFFTSLNDLALCAS